MVDLIIHGKIEGNLDELIVDYIHPCNGIHKIIIYWTKANPDFKEIIWHLKWAISLSNDFIFKCPHCGANVNVFIGDSIAGVLRNDLK